MLRTWGLSALLLVLSAASATAQPPRVNADALVSVEFLKRVDQYLALHKKVLASMPSLPDRANPTQVDMHERTLARLIAEARPGARQGDLLTQDTRAYFRRQIGTALSGPDGAAIRQSIMDENPGKVQLRVNARYPDGLPFTTMPPHVLGALPKLPPDMEFRFLGTRLLLLDVHPQLVVDYMDDALPVATRR